jgi:small subunit ribosomal protein S10
MEKIRLKLKAYDHRVLDRSVSSIVDTVKRTGAQLIGPIPLPTNIRKYTVVKGPHVNKSSREQFEIRVHKRVMDILSATPDTVDSLMKLDLAAEVDVEVRSMGQE